MKSKAFLVSLIAVFAVAFVMASVAASECNDYICVNDVKVNDISITGDSIGQAISGTVSETIPIVVKFTALQDASDLKIKAYVEGYKNDISDETSRFHILEGNTYIKRFSLKLPSSMDLDELSEDLSLLVRVSAKGKDAVEVYVPLEIQKESYSLNVLSIESEDVVVAGSQLAIDVVVENNGNDRLDNAYVLATIPGLGISRKVYVGDLSQNVDSFDDDVNDARERRVYLTIPKNAKAGNYELEVEAYNYDTSITATKRIVVRDVETGVLPSTTQKTISPGGEATFSVVLVNPSDRMVVYTITPEQTKGVLVEVSEPVIAVGPESSKTVTVKVKATEDLEAGTYIVNLNANSDTGLVKQTPFTVNVEGTKTVKPDENTKPADTVTRPSTTVILTVVLVIIFVVLLIVLIVLLTARPAEQEEFGETNYY